MIAFYYRRESSKQSTVSEEEKKLVGKLVGLGADELYHALPAGYRAVQLATLSGLNTSISLMNTLFGGHDDLVKEAIAFYPPSHQSWCVLIDEWMPSSCMPCLLQPPTGVAFFLSGDCAPGPSSRKAFFLRFPERGAARSAPQSSECGTGSETSRTSCRASMTLGTSRPGRKSSHSSRRR